jgi:molecular chaperone GrpE
MGKEKSKIKGEVSVEVQNEVSVEVNELENLSLKLKESEEKYVRLYAEFDNYKKRVNKEKDDIKNNTKISMISSILDMDNDISLAIKNIKDESAKQGVELISNKVTSFLKNQGIETIQTENYDEDIHEVISVLEIGESKIIDVVSKGYSIDGKPFRYPKIILGK